jgi:hypothetical protein
MPVRSVYDRGLLSRVAGEQFGVIGRSQALETGLSPGAIDRLVQPGGRWQKIVPGVYATTTGNVSPDQRAIAALLHAGPQSVITGPAAVRRHRLRCPGLNEVDVLVPLDVRVQSIQFVRVIHTSRMPDGIYTTGHIRFAPVERAVADAARGMSRLNDVRAVVAEAIQHGHCHLASLSHELAEGPTVGSRYLRKALAEVGEGIRSSAEADLKELIHKSGLQEPLYNARLYAADGTFLAVVDAWWQRAGVAAEVDSREYHLSPDDYEHTTSRHNKLAEHGINVLHFLPSSLKRDPAAILVNLRGAIKRGNAQPPIQVQALPTLA